MGEKSTQKKRHIIEKAREVFAKKGYKAVTMKDIVEACNISRGGLYLYFSSVREVFEAVIRSRDHEEENDEEKLSKALSARNSASDMLALFIKEQKRSVFKRRNNLTIATYEYYSEISAEGGDNPMRSQFDTAVMIVERMVEAGISGGEFDCADPYGWASNLMFVIEGMRMLHATMGVTEEMFDRECLYVLEQLVPEDA